MANENSGQNENQNTQQPEEVITTVVDVGTFVETLLERQDDFEAEIRGELRALDLVVKEALAKSLATIEELIEKRMRRPPAGVASSN